MQSIDRSRAILTGMIFTAVCVILLHGFSRETYVLRGPVVAAGSASYDLASSESRPVTLGNRSGRVCSVEREICSNLYPDAGERQSCEGSIRGLFEAVTARSEPLILDRIQQALRDILMR